MVYRDAEDAIIARDGYTFGGQVLRVEKPKERGSGPGRMSNEGTD